MTKSCPPANGKERVRTAALYAPRAYGLLAEWLEVASTLNHDLAHDTRSLLKAIDQEDHHAYRRNERG